MSALARYFEDEGIATTIVALVREHAVAMKPPRALWVPFELGRPFGAPHDNELQRRVLRAALALLDRPGPGPILEDFTEEAPHPEGDAEWQFPAELDQSSVMSEAANIFSIWSSLVQRKSRTSVGISGFTPLEAVEYIARLDSDDPMPNPRGMARISRARYAIDDIKACYLEAATAGDGHPSSRQLLDWFWEHSLAAKMILDFQDRARNSDDKNLRLIASSLVPAERTHSFRRQ